VSSTPGKTITVNYYLVSEKLYLVDLPGYGFALRSKEDKQRWSKMTEAYFENNTALKKIIQLIDCKVGITEDDANMIDWMDSFEIPYIIVCTKCDKLNKTDLKACAEKIIGSPVLKPGTEIIFYSSETGMGRDELMKRIVNI